MARVNTQNMKNQADTAKQAAQDTFEKAKADAEQNANNDSATDNQQYRENEMKTGNEAEANVIDNEASNPDSRGTSFEDKKFEDLMKDNGKDDFHYDENGDFDYDRSSDDGSTEDDHGILEEQNDNNAREDAEDDIDDAREKSERDEERQKQKEKQRKKAEDAEKKADNEQKKITKDAKAKRKAQKKADRAEARAERETEFYDRQKDKAETINKRSEAVTNLFIGDEPGLESLGNIENLIGAIDGTAEGAAHMDELHNKFDQFFNPDVVAQRTPSAPTKSSQASQIPDKVTDTSSSKSSKTKEDESLLGSKFSKYGL